MINACAEKADPPRAERWLLAMGKAGVVNILTVVIIVVIVVVVVVVIIV